RLERVHLALVRGAHRAARAVEHGIDVARLLLPRLEELAHPRLEDARQRAVVVRLDAHLLVQRTEVAVLPALGLEAGRGELGGADREPLPEDDAPRAERDRKSVV